MRIPSRFRTLLVCCMLEYAALMGSPMRLEEIQDLLRAMNHPKLAHVLPDESDCGDGGPTRDRNTIQNLNRNRNARSPNSEPCM